MKVGVHKRMNSGTTNNANQEDLSDPSDMKQNRIIELETLVANLKHMLDISRVREKKLAHALEEFGVNVSLVADVESGVAQPLPTNILICPLEPQTTFLQSLIDRGGWLAGLLVFQSFSSFILASNESLLQTHPSIVFFLTMLVGAGGNAGNQAAVRVIRGIAIGALNEHTVSQFIVRELFMAFSLSLTLGAAGLLRALLSAQTSLSETVAITITLMIIVFISIVTGALLPLLLHQIKIDPAHSSTSIQVIMDISGVLITCSMSSMLLDSTLGRLFLAKLGVFG
jgi:cation transporter-like permease